MVAESNSSIFPILITSGDEGSISSATFELLLLEGTHTSEAECTLRCFIPMQPPPLVKLASTENSQDWLSLSKRYLWKADVPWLVRRRPNIRTLRDTWQQLGDIVDPRG